MKRGDAIFLPCLLLVGTLSATVSSHAGESLTVACSTAPSVQSPVTSNANCATIAIPVPATTGFISWTHRVHVDGIGLVGASTTVQLRAIGGATWTNGTSRTCGIAVNSCGTAESGSAALGAFNTEFRAVCAWAGAVAINATVTCELNVTYV